MLLLRFAAIFVLLSRIAFARSVPSYTVVLGGLPAIWSLANFVAASSLILVSLTLVAANTEQPKRQLDLASWTILPLGVLVDVLTGYPIRALSYPVSE